MYGFGSWKELKLSAEGSSEQRTRGPQHIPLIALRDAVVLPHQVIPLFIGREASLLAVSDAMKKDKRVFFAKQTDKDVDDPTENDISQIGTVGKLLQLLELPDGTVKALVEGISRAKPVSFAERDGFYQADVEIIEETSSADVRTMAIGSKITEAFKEYARLTGRLTDEVTERVEAITDPGELADRVASQYQFTADEKQHVLETIAIEDRLSQLLDMITAAMAHPEEIEEEQANKRMASIRAIGLLLLCFPSVAEEALRLFAERSREDIEGELVRIAERQSSDEVLFEEISELKRILPERLDRVIDRIG